MDTDLSHFIHVIRRISLFKGLKPDQALTLLKTCDRHTLDTRDQLCAIGDPSNELFILLSGKLSVRTDEGVQIAVIEPVAPVGEMGIFTGEPRSATVIAAEPSTLLSITKTQLEVLMRRKPGIEIAISRNLIAILSQRLRHANSELAHLQSLLADLDAGQ